jgi:hypothetical protein
VIDVIRALLGRRTCPWCHCDSRGALDANTLYDQFIDLFPRYPMFLIRYDAWAGRAGGGWHHNHHHAKAA